MATILNLIPVEEYLRTSYRPDCDYVDGELEERNVGEFKHNRMQALLLFWLMKHETEWGITLVPEQRMHVADGRYRVCDVVLLGAEAPREDVTETAPVLCIEIMSPEDRISRAVRVLADYAAMGVPQSWLIDQLRQEAFVYDSRGLHPVEQDRLELPGTPVYLILSDLFAALDKK